MTDQITPISTPEQAIEDRHERIARQAVTERWPRGWARSSKIAALPMIVHALQIAERSTPPAPTAGPDREAVAELRDAGDPSNLHRAVEIVTKAVPDYNGLPQQRKIDLAEGAFAVLMSTHPAGDAIDRAREAFLDLIADAGKWEEQPDEAAYEGADFVPFTHTRNHEVIGRKGPAPREGAEG